MKSTVFDTLQKNFGAESIQKIDPNTQEINLETPADINLVAQAVIPAVLTGLYKYTRTEAHSDNILRGNISTDWVKILFGSNRHELSKRIAEYASIPVPIAAKALQHTSFEAVKLIRQRVKDEEGGAGVKKIMTDQRNQILQHLPAALQLGEMLDDSSLDDRTNKMEGPVSSVMHAIEKTFAGTDQPGENKKPEL